MSDLTSGEHPIVMDRCEWDRRRWWVWFLFALAAVVMSVAMTFTLIVSIQRADRADDIEAAFVQRQECRAAFNAWILHTEQIADNGEHALFVATIRGIFVTEEATNSEAAGAELLSQADRIDRMNLNTNTAIMAYEDYLEAGSPLPCPLTDIPPEETP
jgi:hypothetical protein